MEDDIPNYLPTFRFHGTPCSSNELKIVQMSKKYIQMNEKDSSNEQLFLAHLNYFFCGSLELFRLLILTIFFKRPIVLSKPWKSSTSSLITQVVDSNRLLNLSIQMTGV